MKTTLSILALCTCFGVNAQSTREYSRKFTEIKSDNISRYGEDYIVLNHDFNGDSTILNQISLSDLEHLRKENENVVVQDHGTLLEVLLIARKNIGIKGENILND